MTETPPAAFRATYSDWKLIRTRKCVQIVLEVPLEESDIAYQVLGGMPNPAAETWCAVARLRPSGVVQAPSTPAPALEQSGNLTQAPARATSRLTVQAAILCDDELFQAYLRRRWSMPTVIDKDTAATGMKQILCIKSRKELLPESEAAYWYNVMMADYEAWAHPDIIGETPEAPGLPQLAANATVRDLPRQHHD